MPLSTFYRPRRIEPLFPRGRQIAGDTLEVDGEPDFLVAAVRAGLGDDPRGAAHVRRKCQTLPARPAGTFTVLSPARS